MRKTILASLAAGVVAWLAVAPAHAMFGDDEARKAILELRDRMAAAQNAQQQLQGQIDQLREQNAQLTGRIEQLANDLTVQQRSVKTLFGDLDGRLTGLEAREDTVDGAQVKVSAEEERRFKLALKLFTEEKYDEAADLMDSLAVDYPESPYAANALYWQGNALYAADELKASVTVQDRLIKRYPKHARVPEAMLSKAAAQIGLGQKSAATATLKAVVKAYPGTDAAKVAQERLASLAKKPVRKSK